MGDVISDEHKKAVMKFKKLYALYKENEVLIRIGAYTKGVDAELDEAVSKIESMKNFMLQGAEEIYSYEQIEEMLLSIV
jgi:flagellum-specific ATP synthase